MTLRWQNDHRPGYFGRERDKKIAEFNERFKEGNWRIVWRVEYAAQSYGVSTDFLAACINYYEKSYLEYLSKRKPDVDYICSFGECIDNSPTNVASGLDYTKQESYSTHIQDIAIRNVLRKLGRRFEGPADKILVIRGEETEGFRFGPGNIPFYNPALITQPSLVPAWAKPGSVEDFWQSNKWVQVYR